MYFHPHYYMQTRHSVSKILFLKKFFLSSINSKIGLNKFSNRKLTIDWSEMHQNHKSLCFLKKKQQQKSHAQIMSLNWIIFNALLINIHFKSTRNKYSQTSNKPNEKVQNFLLVFFYFVKFCTQKNSNFDTKQKKKIKQKIHLKEMLQICKF